MANKPPPYEHLLPYERLSLEFVWGNHEPIGSNILWDDRQPAYKWKNTPGVNDHAPRRRARCCRLVTSNQTYLTYQNRTSAIDAWVPEVLNPLPASTGFYCMLTPLFERTSSQVMDTHWSTRYRWTSEARSLARAVTMNPTPTLRTQW
jgi:hypothetical protein